MSTNESSDETIRILLIEDSRADVKVVKNALAATTGPVFKLAEATTLADGIDFIRDQGADIVLTDLHLPDSNGTDTVSRLSEVAPDTPLIVLTGSTDQGGLRYIAAGAHDYLSKDEFKPLNLRRSLSYALERHHQMEILGLRRALEHYKGLTSAGIQTSTTQRISGDLPLRTRDPQAFEVLEESYASLFDPYLEHLILSGRKPIREMQQTTAQLGDLGAGPRELMDLHVAAMAKAMSSVQGERARAYTHEGRLLALEMMGQLVEYYRAGVVRSRKAEKP